MGRKLFRLLTPGRVIAPIAIVGVMVACAPAAGAAVNTWAGVWNSDFGRLTLDAGGSGSYTGFNPGTLSGTVTGNVDQGTWNQPGNPPKSGKFKFTLSPGGLTFTGDWAYDSGGCGSACGWNGTCIEGPCLQNGTATGCAAAAFRAGVAAPCLSLTPPSVRPLLGVPTAYGAPLPGTIAKLPTPVIGRKAKTAVVEIGTASESGAAGAAPPVVAVVLTRSQQEERAEGRRARQAFDLCGILTLSGDKGVTVSYAQCLEAVLKILERYDKIQANTPPATQAAQTSCRSVKLKRRGKHRRGAARIRCEATATGLRLTFRKRGGGPSLRSLFGRKSRLVVGRSRFDTPAVPGDRVNVTWRTSR